MTYSDNQTPRFSRSYKKLSPRELGFLHATMDLLIRDPEIGDQKKGDFSALFVYKFKIGNSKWLLGYIFNRSKKIITWHAVGRHENF